MSPKKRVINEMKMRGKGLRLITVFPNFLRSNAAFIYLIIHPIQDDGYIHKMYTKPWVESQSIKTDSTIFKSSAFQFLKAGKHLLLSRIITT